MILNSPKNGNYYNSQESKKDYYKRLFSSLTPRDFQAHPELSSAVKYDKKIRFDLLTDDKPKFISTKNIHNEKKLRVINNVNSFRDIFFKYNSNEKRSLGDFSKLKRDNDLFSARYQSMEAKSERIKRKEKFPEIKAEYDKKNYKLPSIDKDHNIFKKNILLLSDYELSCYFLYQQGGDQSKQMEFLSRLDDDMLEKQFGKGPDNGSGEMLSSKTAERKYQEQAKSQRTKKKKGKSLSQEIKENRREITSVKKTFNNMEEIDKFFDPNVKDYYSPEYAYYSNSRQTSGKYSTRVNSAIKFENQKELELSTRNVSSLQTLDSSPKSRPIAYKKKSNVLSPSMLAIKKVPPPPLFPSNKSRLKSTAEYFFEELKMHKEIPKERMQRFLKKHHYNLSTDVSPRIALGQVHNNKEKTMDKSAIKKGFELRRNKLINSRLVENDIWDQNRQIERSMSNYEMQMFKLMNSIDAA